jgi:glutamyl-tRNA reductase
LKERRIAAEKIEIMIEAEIIQFKQWINTLGVVPVISALRQKALTIQAETMESIERKMPNLTERERKLLSKHTKSIINQLLKDPILKVKELSAGENADDSLDLFMKIFNIEKAVEEQVQKERAEKLSFTSNEQLSNYRASLQS